MSVYGVIVFHTTSAALRAEKALLQQGSQVKLIPTPRQISSDCGLALRFTWSEIERQRALLEAARVEFAAIRPIE